MIPLVHGSGGGTLARRAGGMAVPSTRPHSAVMEFGASAPPASGSRDAVGAAPEGKHSSRHMTLTLYTDLPSGSISVEEFEALALDRLRVLKGIEEMRLRNRSEDDIKRRAKELIETHLEGASLEETLRRDQTSHYILRLGYCRTPDLRKWLLTQESDLFKLRFTDLMDTQSYRDAFMKRSGLSYTPLDRTEQAALDDELRQVMHSQATPKEMVEAELEGGFYKVPFTSVPDLVAGRRVLLRGGWAYVSHRDLVSLVVQDFRALLSKGLADINRRYRDMFPDSDTRLRPLVAGLSGRYLGSREAGAAAGARYGGLTAASLPAAAARHFPLCMQHLMTQLGTTHHLRHTGRQQLSLFLKAVGLPLEDALIFWRTAFAPIMPADKFEKEHAYNIRHNYGKEGGRKDYSAHNCLTLVRMTGGAGDHHGCPYKRLDAPALRTALARAGCEPSKAEEAVVKARGGHYQIACACAFEGCHSAPLDTGINHPAEYYAESRRVYEERAAAAAPVASASAHPTVAPTGMPEAQLGAAAPGPPSEP